MTWDLEYHGSLDAVTRRKWEDLRGYAHIFAILTMIHNHNLDFRQPLLIIGTRMHPARCSVSHSALFGLKVVRISEQRLLGEKVHRLLYLRAVRVVPLAIWIPRVDDTVASPARTAVVGCAAHVRPYSSGENTRFHVWDTSVVAGEAAVSVADALLADGFVDLLFVGNDMRERKNSVVENVMERGDSLQ